MAFRISSQSGKTVYGLKEFVVDVFDDIAKIPTRDLVVGSTAFVIETSEHYMLNTKRQWMQVDIGGGSNKNNPDDYDIIYDGGLIEIIEEPDVDINDDIIYDGGGVNQ